MLRRIQPNGRWYHKKKDIIATIALMKCQLCGRETIFNHPNKWHDAFVNSLGDYFMEKEYIKVRLKYFNQYMKWKVLDKNDVPGALAEKGIYTCSLCTKKNKSKYES